jgi:tetratricopeptide (TPR) repeat protein
MGGVGKSTVALAVAKLALGKGRRVWWINSVTTATLTGCVAEMLDQLNAPASVIEAVRSGAASAAERTWNFLNSSNVARRALLVFDSADDPAVLAAAGEENPSAGTGWLRPDRCRVLVLVTTRHKDREAWGEAITFRELQPLSDEASAKVLADLGPLIADRSGREASDLGHRLGGLPLALHLAGKYLRSPFAEMRSFADFHAALDGSVDAVTDQHNPGDHVRAALRQTWNLSLEALADGGRPQARPLLYLLCCYSPATPIPLSLFQAELLRPLLCASDTPARSGIGPLNDLPQRLRSGWKALYEVGLIDVVSRTEDGDSTAVTVHLLVADVNRASMLAMAQHDLKPISHATVDLLKTAAGKLDFRLPADWPAWRQLAPHISAALSWLASRLDREALVSLLNVSDATARALLRSGSIAVAGNLVRSEVEAATTLGAEHPAYLAARCSQATMVRWQGRYLEAETLHREVLVVQQRVLGDANPDTLRTLHNLAWEMADEGRYAEAEQLHRQVLADRRRVLGDDHPDTLDSRLKLVQVIARQQRYGEAERLYKELIAAQRRILGSDHPDTMEARHALAEVIAEQGRHEEAERLHRDVLADRQRLLGRDHPDTLNSRHGLAEVIAEQDRHEEAERLHRDVLADRQRLLGRDHPDTMNSQNALAKLIAAHTDSPKPSD